MVMKKVSPTKMIVVWRYEARNVALSPPAIV
jgi:hypothetical protein